MNKPLNAAQALTAAADLLTSGGCVAHTRSKNGAYCALGAICMAVNGTVYGSDDHPSVVALAALIKERGYPYEPIYVIWSPERDSCVVADWFNSWVKQGRCADAIQVFRDAVRWWKGNTNGPIS